MASSSARPWTTMTAAPFRALAPTSTGACSCCARGPIFKTIDKNLSRIAICADLQLAARHRHGRPRPPKMPPPRRSGRRPRFLGAPQTRQRRPLAPRLGRAVALPRVIEQELAHEPAEHGACAAKWGAAAWLSQLYGTQCEVARSCRFRRAEPRRAAGGCCSRSVSTPSEVHFRAPCGATCRQATAPRARRRRRRASARRGKMGTKKIFGSKSAEN